MKCLLSGLAAPLLLGVESGFAAQPTSPANALVAALAASIRGEPGVAEPRVSR